MNNLSLSICNILQYVVCLYKSQKFSKDQEGIWRLMSSGTLASFSQFDFPAFIADMF